MCPTDVDALAKTQARRTEKGRTRGPDPSSLAIVFWCGAHGHTMSDFRKKAAGRPRSAPSRTVSGLKAETKEANVVKEPLSFEKRPDTDKEAMCRSIGSVSRREKVQPASLASLGKDPGTGASSTEISQERRIWCQCGGRRNGVREST